MVAFLDNLGFGELALIFIIALIVFGPERLPDLTRAAGKAVAEFRKATRDLTQDVTRAALQDVVTTTKQPAPKPVSPPAKVTATSNDPTTQFNFAPAAGADGQSAAPGETDLKDPAVPAGAPAGAEAAAGREAAPITPLPPAVHPDDSTTKPH